MQQVSIASERVVELRHLRYFLAVADTLHFGRAAQALGIRQPPLSQQVRALEEDLGVSLFNRSSRRVQLTAAGEAFRADAKRALDAAATARRAAQRAGRGDTGELVLGFVGSATLTLLPLLLRHFGGLYPEVRLTLRELPTAEQAKALRDGVLDVGLLRPPLTSIDAEAVQVQPIAAERLTVALPASHPLARDRTVAGHQLADEPFVLFPRHLGPGLYDQITAYCRQAGFEPRIAQEAAQMQTIVALVAGGLGVSLVPSSVEGLRRTDVVYRPVRPVERVVHLAVARREDDLRPTTRNFVNLALDLAGSAPRRRS
jgi:DNA-binding transcriptional LysR family regulator